MNPQPPAAASEARLVQVLDRYLAAVEAGAAPPRDELLAQHPDLVDDLRECLASLEFIRRAGLRPVPAPEEGGDGLPAGVLGDFRIVRKVGQGGMGVVYEAVQESLGRRVALKVLPPAATLDPRQLQRFQHEAQAAACLHHTNIVPVYAVGSERGVHFYAMQFIDGQSLADLVRALRTRAGLPDAGDGAVTTSGAQTAPEAVEKSAAADTLAQERSASPVAYCRTVARLGVQAAEALEHAHQLGIVHRDVKPANLMVDGRGHLWVADFGLAQVHSGAGLTLTGDLVGTLRYMSPEQALGRRAGVDHRSDVYSLGVTLYELLTLEHAFDGADRQDLLRRVTQEEPAPPRRRNPAVPPELEVIVLKAMAKDRDERYGSAKELADDLRRFLEDRPIRARRPTLWQRLRRWARRHQAVVATAGVSLFVLLAVTVAVLAAAYARVSDEKELTKKAYEELKAANAGEQQALYYYRLHFAAREWAAGNAGRVEPLLDLCPAGLRQWEWHYLKGQCHADLLTLRGHAAAVHGVAFSPDGTRLAACDFGGGVRLWDVRAGREALALAGHERAQAVAFSPDGRRLASAGGDLTIKVWDAATGQELHTLKGHSSWVYGVAFGPDCRRLASVDREGGVRVWDVAGGREAVAFQVPHDLVPIYSVAFSPDGTQLAIGCYRGAVGLWDAGTGRPAGVLRAGEAQVEAVAFSPDGDRLAAATLDQVKVWQLPAAGEPLTLRGHADRVLCVAFSPDGSRLVSAGEDRAVKVWGLPTGNEPFTLRGHTDAVRGVAFSPDGLTVASAGLDRTVKLWDATQGPECHEMYDFTTLPHFLLVSLDGRLLVARANATGRQAQLLDMASGRVVRTLPAHDGAVGATAFTRDGRRLATAGEDRIVKVWDLATGEEVCALRGRRGVIFDLAFSPDGNRLAIADGPARVVAVFDANTGELVCSCPGNEDPVNHLAFSPDGRRLASAGDDKTIKVWDAQTGDLLLTLLGHEGRVSRVAFSPDGRRLASASHDRTVRTWDAASGEALRVLQGHVAAVTGVAYSPDGKRLASSSDRGVKLWDPASGEEYLTLSHPRNVFSVAFTPDGRCLVSVGADQTVRVWDAGDESDAQAKAARQEARTWAWHNREARRCEAARHGPGAVWHLERLAVLDPADEQLRPRLAAAYAHRASAVAVLGAWDLAAADSAHAVELGLDVTDLERLGWQPAWLRIYRGDPAARRAVAAGLLERYAATDNSRLAQLAARLTLLLPDSVADPATAVRLAKRAVNLEQTNSFYWGTLALAHYRQGDDKAAVEAFVKAEQLRGLGVEMAEELLIRAMAHWRLGERARARQYYARASDWLEKNPRWLDANRLAAEELRHFRAEAARLLEIEGDRKPTDPGGPPGNP